MYLLLYYHTSFTHTLIPIFLSGGEDFGDLPGVGRSFSLCRALGTVLQWQQDWGDSYVVVEMLYYVAVSTATTHCWFGTWDYVIW